MIVLLFLAAMILPLAEVAEVRHNLQEQILIERWEATSAHCSQAYQICRLQGVSPCTVKYEQCEIDAYRRWCNTTTQEVESCERL